METAAITVLIFAAAMFYSAVGNAGASGYLAVLALFGLPPVEMKSAAIALNILVSTLGTWRFARAGFFSWRTLWPFLIGSVPLAFVGGAIQLPARIFGPVVGAILMYAAVRLVTSIRERDQQPIQTPPVPVAVGAGAGIGLLSGITGTGGGIFLSPLLIMRRWSETRHTAGVASAFILVNSLAGLGGHLSSVTTLPSQLPFWAVAAVLGGYAGTELAVRRLAPSSFRIVLAAILVVAGLKLASAAVL